MSRRRPLLVAASALFAFPASQASAAQTTQLRYQCKYPLIGIWTADLRLDLELADRWPAGGPEAIDVKARFSAYDADRLAVTVEGLVAIEGAATMFASINTEQGFRIPIKAQMAVPSSRVSWEPEITNPVVLDAAGTTAGVIFDDPGAATVTLDRFALNLVAIDPNGDPIPLPPVTKDLAGNKVSDSDGDPNTFDVYCALAPAQQDLRLATFVVGEGPLPSLTPRPTLEPTPSPTGATPTPYPSYDVTPPTMPTDSFDSQDSDITHNSLQVRWGASVDEPDGSGLDHYVVAYEDRSFEVPAEQTTLLLTGLTPESDYDVFVTAVDKAGNPSLPLYLAYSTRSLPIGEPTPVPTSTPVPTATPVRTATPVPTATPVGMTPTPAPTPSGEGERKLTLTYQCKYPLVGVKRLTLDSTMVVPNGWPTSVPTQPYLLTHKLSLSDMVAGFEAIDRLASLEGTTLTYATVKTAQGFNVPAKTLATIPTTALTSPVPDPVVLTATGATPSLTFDDPGVEQIYLDKLAINLTARDEAGQPIPLPPVTKDIDGNKVGDSDGDNGTFDVYCKLDPATQSTFYGTFEILDWAPPTPIVVGTPAPTPSPTSPPTATPSPTTGATPGPTATPTPSTDTNPPTMPGESFEGVESDVTDTSIVVRWLPSVDVLGGSGLDHYIVNYEDQYFEVPADQTSFKLTGLAPNADLDIFVYAVDKAGNASLPLYLPFTMRDAASPTPTTAPPTPTPTPSPSPAPPTAKYSYSLTGSTKLNTLAKGSMPLTGSVDATLALASGAVTADLKLNDSQGRLTALGFLPVTAAVGFVTSGQTTGRLVDDQLTTNSKVRIKVKGVKAFGVVPLAGGNNCQTKSLSEITLKSTDSFDPTGTGGTLAGTYAISDLNGCGPLNGLVSPITAGAGNTISVKLTPNSTPTA